MKKLLCLLFLCALILPQEGNAVSREDDLYKQADEVLTNYKGDVKSLEEANDYLQEILKINPRYALAYVGLARLEYKAGYINSDNYKRENLEKAHKYIDEAVGIDPKLFEAYLARAHVYIFQKNLPMAKRALDEAVKIRPASQDANIVAVEIAYKERNYDLAMKKSLEVIASTDDKRLKSMAYSILAVLYRMKKEYDLADKAYMSNMEMDPDSPWIKVSYSSFLIERGNYDKAIELSRQALEAMDFVHARRVLGLAYYKKGYDLYKKKHDYENAAINFKLALEIEPGLSDAKRGLALAKMELERSKIGNKGFLR